MRSAADRPPWPSAPAPFGSRPPWTRASGASSRGAVRLKRVRTSGLPRDLAYYQGRIYVSSEGPGYDGSIVAFDAASGTRQDAMERYSCSIAAGSREGVWSTECRGLQDVDQLGGDRARAGSQAHPDAPLGGSPHERHVPVVPVRLGGWERFRLGVGRRGRFPCVEDRRETWPAARHHRASRSRSAAASPPEAARCGWRGFWMHRGQGRRSHRPDHRPHPRRPRAGRSGAQRRRPMGSQPARSHGVARGRPTPEGGSYDRCRGSPVELAVGAGGVWAAVDG